MWHEQTGDNRFSKATEVAVTTIMPLDTIVVLPDILDQVRLEYQHRDIQIMKEMWENDR